jgi:uncharacterized protein (TIGR02246 family)
MRDLTLTILVIMLIWPAACFSAEGTQGGAKAAPAVPAGSAQSSEEKAVMASAEAFTAAFNKADAKAIAALWTKDGEYVDETGRVLRGREAIEKEYAAFLAANPGLKMESTVSSVKIVRGNAAFERGTTVLKKPNGALVSKGRYTAVLLREGDKWLMAGVREHAAPSLSTRPGFEDLEWLIGDWTGTKDGKTVDFAFKWIADKKFIELSYSARDKDAAIRSGIQIFGRDPSSGRVISWSFDSNGGYGQGEWTLLKKGWIVESHGILPDGALAVSTDIVFRMDEDSFSWRSVNRRVAEHVLPDAEPIVLKRKSP